MSKLNQKKLMEAGGVKTARSLGLVRSLEAMKEIAVISHHPVHLFATTSASKLTVTGVVYYYWGRRKSLSSNCSTDGLRHQGMRAAPSEQQAGSYFGWFCGMHFPQAEATCTSRTSARLRIHAR
jgi:hypothetical protein